MPEAPMHENNGLEPLQDKVWASRQVTAVEAKSEASGVKTMADQDFRFRVLAPNTGHHF
jgi:hypothetical protein